MLELLYFYVRFLLFNSNDIYKLVEIYDVCHVTKFWLQYFEVIMFSYCTQIYKLNNSENKYKWHHTTEYNVFIALTHKFHF